MHFYFDRVKRIVWSSKWMLIHITNLLELSLLTLDLDEKPVIYKQNDIWVDLTRRGKYVENWEDG